MVWGAPGRRYWLSSSGPFAFSFLRNPKVEPRIRNEKLEVAMGPNENPQKKTQVGRWPGDIFPNLPTCGFLGYPVLPTVDPWILARDPYKSNRTQSGTTWSIFRLAKVHPGVRS